METKEAKMIQAAECALQIFAQEGLENLSFTKVSQRCKISRAWLYKYIGQSPRHLLDFAVDHFGKAFTVLEQRPPVLHQQSLVNNIHAGVQRVFDYAEKSPWIIRIYYRYAGTNTALGERIQNIESAYAKVVTAEAKKSIPLFR